MAIPSIDEANVSAYFDADQAVAFVTYRGNIGADESRTAYQWLTQLIDTLGENAIRGEVFDFSKVRMFTTDNLLEARRHSRRLNLALTEHAFPVAMIISTAMHEEILRGPMQVVPENTRKRIVRSDEEAIAFIDLWHEQSTATS